MGDYFGHRGGEANFKNPVGVIAGILKASRMNSATTAENILPFPLCISARLARVRPINARRRVLNKLSRPAAIGVRTHDATYLSVVLSVPSLFRKMKQY